MTRVLFLLACLLSFPVLAAEKMQTALAMHGAPKHGANFASYAFVNPNAPKGGVLHQSAVGTFDTLNPFTLKGKAAQGLALVHDRLMDRSWDEPFTLYPLIARGVTVPDDRSFITFHLDPRARFQDGTPITAADVVFSFETLKAFGRPNMRRVYKLVKDVTLPDAQSVKFTLGPDRDRETVMILGLMPILSKKYWSAHTFDAATLAPYVASGPYKIGAVDAGRKVVFERVKDYWAEGLPVRKGQYNFDRVVYDYFRDEAVAFESFKSGDLNFRREIDLTQWANGYKGLTSKREAIPHGRAEAIRGFIFNTRRPPFDDIRVRQALGLVFDFEWVNANLFSGQLRRTDSFFPNSALAAKDPPDDLEIKALAAACDCKMEMTHLAKPAVSGTPAAIRENLQRADQLLKDAGWVVKNGVRVNAKTGKPLAFGVLLGAPEDEKIALSWARSLKRLGIAARPRTLDVAAFRDRLNGYDYDVLFYFWLGTLSPGGEQALYWGCPAAKVKGQFNYAGICDPAIDKLSASIAQTKTADDLQSHARALDRMLLSGAYMVPFGYNPADLVAYGPSIRRPAQNALWGIVPEAWWAEPPPEVQNTPSK